MIVKHDSAMEPQPVTMDGAADVTIRIPIGPEDGSENMIMRLFCIAPGGHTPCHSHNFEHLVRVVSGHGTATDASGTVHELAPGQSVFVAPNEEHQFANPYEIPFEFTCTILNADSMLLKR